MVAILESSGSDTGEGETYPDWAHDKLVSGSAPLGELDVGADAGIFTMTFNPAEALQPGPSALTGTDFVPATTSTTYSIAVGSSVDVVIETIGDHDWYGVNLIAGVTYTIETSFDETSTDAYLNLRDATGAILLSDDDSGEVNNSLISFTPTTSGTYYIDAGTYNNDTTGTYHLFVAPIVPVGDVVGGSVATASSLALGGTVNGNVDSSGDHDYYAINLVAGQTYIFRTAQTTASDTTDTQLILRNSAGTQIISNDDAGQSSYSAIRYTATTSGTYYLDVTGLGTATGAYNLTAFTALAPEVWTYDQIAGQLTTGYWGGSSHHFPVTQGGTITFNVSALTAEGQVLARAATALWGDVLGVTFREVTTGGQIVYDDNQTGAFASASYSGGITSSARVNVSTDWLTTYGTSLNSYVFQAYVHETGHALGLGHAGNYNSSASYTSDSLYLNDSWATTVMSYFSQTENTWFQNQGFTREYVVTPMMADIVAMISLYGTNTTTRTGNTTYGFNNNSGRDVYDAAQFPTVAYTVFDNGGTDTLDYSGFGQTQSINLNAETFSNVGGKVGNVSIARGTVIENAIGGSGNDTIIGNSAANVLTGGTGSDILISGGGIDTLLGGAGNDRIELGTGSSGSIVDGGTDTDTLVITGAVSPGSIANIEAVELGAAGVLTLTGAQLASWLPIGTQYSGTGTLAVNMAAASTFYAMNFVIAAGSTVTFAINAVSGTNVIKSSLSVINVLSGGSGIDQIRGGNFVDTINGGDGNDKIMGLGGADVLTGGAGSDQFRWLFATDSGLGAAADRVTDFVAGVDKIDLRVLDSNPLLPGIQPFSYIGSSAFHATGAAEVHHVVSGADMVVEADLNGDGTADMQMILLGAGGQVLGSGDFLL